jgi:hypothetical protein
MPKVQPKKVVAAHNDKTVAGTGRGRREWRFGVTLVRQGTSRQEQRRHSNPAERQFSCRFHIALKKIHTREYGIVLSAANVDFECMSFILPSSC